MDTAQQYPGYTSQIVSAAKTAFLEGDQWAYLAGIVAVLLGAVLVLLKFPKREEERRLLASYASVDSGFGAKGSRPDSIPSD